MELGPTMHIILESVWPAAVFGGLALNGVYANYNLHHRSVQLGGKLHDLKPSSGGRL